MEKNLYLKSGQLSDYGLSCGYVQKYPYDIELTKEHGAYMVRFPILLHGERTVQGFDKLSEARNFITDKLRNLLKSQA